MDFAEVVRGRHSFRAFKPDPVPDATLREVFELANQAPSNCNLQPWHVHVAAGAARDALRERLMAAAIANPSGDADIPWVGRFEGEYRERQIAAAVGLWKHQGVSREDKAMRAWSLMRNFEFFDAPHVAFIFYSGEFAERERIAGDVGMYAQTLMLALRNAGIGSCPQTSLSLFPDVLRSALGVDERYRLLMGLSFGYVDEGQRVNEFRAERAPLEATTTFHDVAE